MLYFPKNTTSVSCTSLYTHTHGCMDLSAPPTITLPYRHRSNRSTKKSLLKLNSLFLAWKRELVLAWSAQPSQNSFPVVWTCILYCVDITPSVPRKMETCNARTPSTWGCHDKTRRRAKDRANKLVFSLDGYLKSRFLWPPLDLQLGRQSKKDLSITDPSSPTYDSSLGP